MGIGMKIWISIKIGRIMIGTGIEIMIGNEMGIEIRIWAKIWIWGGES